MTTNGDDSVIGTTRHVQLVGAETTDPRRESDLDRLYEQDATLRATEHMFDKGRLLSRTQTADPIAATTEAHDGDDGEEEAQGQTRRLTLLPGGLRRTLPTPLGASLPATESSPAQHNAPEHATPPTALRAAPTAASQGRGRPLVNPRFLDPTELTGHTHDPVQRRYRVENHLPPCWSDTATWRDLVSLTEVPDINPARGWSHQWTLTSKHGKTLTTTTVASTNTGDLFAADPIRTANWHPRATARAGLRFATSSQAMYFHESLAERDAIIAFDYDQIIDLVSQPFTLNWHDGTRARSHTPDFLIETREGTVVVNVRPKHLVKPKLIEDCAALQTVCASRGWTHVLITGMNRPAFSNIETLVPVGPVADQWGITEQVTSQLSQHGPLTFADLEAHSEAPVIVRAIVLRLIWERRLRVDLNRLLDTDSTVALPDASPMTEGTHTGRGHA